MYCTARFSVTGPHVHTRQGTSSDFVVRRRAVPCVFANFLGRVYRNTYGVRVTERGKALCHPPVAGV